MVWVAPAAAIIASDIEKAQPEVSSEEGKRLREYAKARIAELKNKESPTTGSSPGGTNPISRQYKLTHYLSWKPFDRSVKWWIMTVCDLCR